MKTALYNLDAEICLLAAILFDSGRDEATDVIMALIMPADFYVEKHKWIYFAMQSLYKNGADIDYVSIADVLEKDNKLNDAGGAVYISTLTSAIPSNTNYRYYLDIVLNYAQLRRMDKLGKFVQDESGSGKNAEELIGLFEDCLNKISMRETVGELEHIYDAEECEFKRLNNAIDGKYDQFGLRTGFKKLDTALWGMQPSNMIVIAARPGVGKTAFALNIIKHASIDNKKVCAFFSLEMAKSEIIQRLNSLITGIDNYTLKSGKDLAKDDKRLIDCKNKIKESGMYIFDERMQTIAGMLHMSKRLKRKTGQLDLVVIDYLQIITPAYKGATRALEVGEIARGIKNIARQLKVPVIALAQLNRQVDKGDEGKPKEPVLSDLRDSGEIEQEADIVAFLHTESKKDMEEKTVHLIMSKFRNGHMRNIPFDYKGGTFTFSEKNIEFGQTKNERRQTEITAVSKVEADNLPF